MRIQAVFASELIGIPPINDGGAWFGTWARFRRGGPGFRRNDARRQEPTEKWLIHVDPREMLPELDLRVEADGAPSKLPGPPLAQPLT